MGINRFRKLNANNGIATEDLKMTHIEKRLRDAINEEFAKMRNEAAKATVKMSGNISSYALTAKAAKLGAEKAKDLAVAAKNEVFEARDDAQRAARAVSKRAVSDCMSTYEQKSKTTLTAEQEVQEVQEVKQAVKDAKKAVIHCANRYSEVKELRDETRTAATEAQQAATELDEAAAGAAAESENVALTAKGFYKFWFVDKYKKVFYKQFKKNETLKAKYSKAQLKEMSKKALKMYFDNYVHGVQAPDEVTKESVKDNAEIAAQDVVDYNTEY